MISDKLKQIIFNELYTQLKDVEIIPYNGSVWFINRSEKYWYLELNSNNHLWWRYSFFVDFFQLFSLEIYQIEPLIREWTEWVLNRGVIKVDSLWTPNSKLIGDVLNHKITKTEIGYYGCRQLIEDMLDSNINTSNHSEYNIDFISNYNILTTGGNVGYGFRYDNIESSSFAKSILTESIEVILNQPDV